MNIGKMIVATLAGGVVYFLLGWIVWGMLLKAPLSMSPETTAMIVRPDAEFGFIAMLLSCFTWSGLLTYIFSKWAGIKSFASGATAGALIAGLVSFSYDMNFVAMYNENFTDWTKALINTASSTGVSAILGGVIGWILGRPSKS